MEWYQRLNQVLDYIEANLYDLDYDAIARLALCPQGVLQRFFALNVGLTLNEYVRNRRLSEAALLLRHTDKRVIDLALDAGYESHTAFGAAFKKFHGVTPSKARAPATVVQSFPKFHFEIKITQKEGASFMEKIESLSTRIAQDPKNVLLLLERMEAYLAAKEYRKAVADMLAASGQFEKHYENDYLEKGFYEADLVRLPDMTPKQAEAFHLHLSGCIDQMRGRYIEAESQASAAIALDDTNAWYYHTRSWLSGDLGNRPQQIADADRAVALSPDTWNHYDKRGWYYAFTNDWEKAVENFAIAIRMDYKATQNLAGMVSGMSHARNHHPAVLIDTYKTLCAENPDDLGLAHQLGHWAFHAGDMQTCVDAYSKMESVDHAQNWLYEWRGRAYFKMRDHAATIADFTKALEKQGPGAVLYLHRGASYYFTGRYEEAAADFARAAELEPDNVWHSIWRGKCHQKSGKPAEAVADFTRAIETDNAHTATLRAYELRAESYFALGETAKAEADLAKIRENKDEADVFWHDWH